MIAKLKRTLSLRTTLQGKDPPPTDQTHTRPYTYTLGATTESESTQPFFSADVKTQHQNTKYYSYMH